MPAPVYVFLDFDNTLSDHTKLGQLYVKELAALLNDRFGQDTGRWAAALKPALDESIHRYVEKFTGNPLAGYNEWLARERVRATEELFQLMGVPLPETEPVDLLAMRLQFEALTACRA